MLYQWEQFFWSFLVIGPFLMTYSWSLSFWVRLCAGFVALSQATSQALLSTGVGGILDPANPFGHHSQTSIALCIGTGVSGAFFCALSESAGLLILQLWGIYCIYTWSVVKGENFLPPWSSDEPQGVFESLTGNTTWVIVLYSLCLAMFVLRVLGLNLWKLNHFLAAVSGACAGAHITVQVIYTVWSEDGMKGALVYGMLVTNRFQWCTRQTSCEIFFYTFCVLIIVSLITQHFVVSFDRLTRPVKPFEPSKFRHPSAVNPGHEIGEMEDKEKDDKWRCLRCKKRQQTNTWASNLATPCSAWIFLFLVVLLSCMATYVFSLFVFWADGTSTNFFVGLLYIVANAFCLWSIIEFFLTTVSFHAIRLILGMPRLPRKEFSRGLPPSARTVLSYCLLSRQQESSEECFKTACEAHLANLDSNHLITTAVVSVSSDLPVVQCEMDCRDRCRKEIVETLMEELKVLLEVFPQGYRVREQETLQMRRTSMHQVLERVSKASIQRVDYWLQSIETAWAAAHCDQELYRDDLLQRVEDAARHFVYLHRNCRILKKPGQYQDLMVLASTGVNEAFTYLREDYGQLGRPAGSACFGFAANVTKPSQMSEEDFASAAQALTERGQQDIALIAGYGSNPDTRYHYTMVLDSDTVCPAKSIRKLLETAEHSANQSYGIINANLANDYSADDSCTMHMWRNALMEVSTVNLQRGQFWIFNRVGFYGKGLVRNDLYITRLIGRPGSVMEALPIDILSHDTVEAKLLQPAIDADVTLYEDVARNPISAMSQSTRWMLGEVRNCCYEASGIYTPLVQALSTIVSLCTKWEMPQQRFVRWREVPCATAAEYLSHTGFRLFHAGPGILLINLCSTVLAANHWALQLVILPIIGFSALLFTVLALFIIPKGFLILDKLPSLRLGRVCLLSSRASKIGDGTFHNKEMADVPTSSFLMSKSNSDTESGTSEPTRTETPPVRPQRLLSRCSVLMRQLALSVIEIILSILLYSPELILGVLRLVRATWAQTTGSANWKPQDTVEREIEKNLSLWYVFKQTWVVFVCGVAYLAYILVFRVTDTLVLLIVVPWILYPISTYVMCLRVPASMKSGFLWTWVMDIKEAEKAIS